MTDNDTDPGSHETDWLAHTLDGFGYGYTKQQALLAVAPHLDDHDELEVDLIEHVGWAKTGLMGWEVETYVSGTRITIDQEDIRRLREVSNTANNIAEKVLDTADRQEIE